VSTLSLFLDMTLSLFPRTFLFASSLQCLHPFICFSPPCSVFVRRLSRIYTVSIVCFFPLPFSHQHQPTSTNMKSIHRHRSDSILSPLCIKYPSTLVSPISIYLNPIISQSIAVLFLTSYRCLFSLLFFISFAAVLFYYERRVTFFLDVHDYMTRPF